jgi:organic radical activating enzyme
VIISRKVKNDCGGVSLNCLPYWELEWQLADDVEHNALITEIKAICNKVERAKYGISLFGGEPFDYGALPENVAIMKARVKSLMQRTHPDKATGYVEEFKQLKDCMSMIRSGIPLPTDKPLKTDVKHKQLG